MASTPLLVVPVISFKAGLATAIEHRLLAAAPSSSPAAARLRASSLQLVEVPVPPPAVDVDASEPTLLWSLTPQQEQALVNAVVVVADAHHGAPLLLTPERRLPRDQQHLLRHVRWVQGTYAGVDAYLKLSPASPAQKESAEGAEQIPPPSFTVTRAGGIQGMVQFVFGCVFASC